MLFLKQSTASQSVLLGPFVDSTDGDTAETGLTIANTDIRLSKNGGNMAAKNSGGGTHDENGWYTITLDATDTDTVGRLQVSCKVSGALAVFMEFQVLEETVYDALIGASAAGELAVKLSTQGKADVNAEVDTALTDYDPPTNAELVSEINAVQTDIAALNDPTAAAIADAVWDEDATGHQTAGTFGEALGDPAASGNSIRDLVSTVDSVVDQLNLGIIYGSAQTGTLSTTQASTDLTGYADDQLIGRLIIWTSGAAEGEESDITDYANASGVITFTALTTAPGNGDTFKVV